MGAITDNPEKVITVNSFSKTYCMCGYRIGYLHAGKDMIKQMLKLKLCVSTCTSNPAQKAAIAALMDREFPEAIKNRFEERKKLLVSGLEELGMPLVEPGGAFYAFPNTSKFGDDEEAFRLFLKSGVLTMPGNVFHEECKNHVRFSFVAGREEIKKGLERLKSLR